MVVEPAELLQLYRQLDEQRQQLEAQRRTLAQQQVALAALQQRVLAELPKQGGGGPEVAGRLAAEQRSPRRSLLRGAGAGAAALLGAGMIAATENVAGATPRAAAADNDPLVIGQTNTGSSTTTLTPVTGATPSVLLDVDNSASPSTADSAAGVQAIGPAGTTGLIGVSNTSLGYGVLGQSDQGYGVVGESSSGIDLMAYGTGRFYQLPLAAAGAPTAGSYLAGEQVRDANGDLYLCTASGSSGTANPPTWKRVAAALPGYAAGAMHLLASPIRLLDTRPGAQAGVNPGAPIAGFTAYELQVTGTLVGSVSIPSGAVGVIGNVTVVNAKTGGNLTLYPAGGDRPNVSNLNYNAGWVIANGVVVALGNGKIEIFVNAPGSTDVVFDASGFIY